MSQTLLISTLEFRHVNSYLYTSKLEKQTYLIIMKTNKQWNMLLIIQWYIYEISHNTPLPKYIAIMKCERFSALDS